MATRRSRSQYQRTASRPKVAKKQPSTPQTASCSSPNHSSHHIPRNYALSLPSVLVLRILIPETQSRSKMSFEYVLQYVKASYESNLIRRDSLYSSGFPCSSSSSNPTFALMKHQGSPSPSPLLKCFLDMLWRSLSRTDWSYLAPGSASFSQRHSRTAVLTTTVAAG
jgi:hypothetical protein